MKRIIVKQCFNGIICLAFSQNVTRTRFAQSSPKRWANENRECQRDRQREAASKLGAREGESSSKSKGWMHAKCAENASGASSIICRHKFNHQHLRHPGTPAPGTLCDLQQLHNERAAVVGIYSWSSCGMRKTAKAARKSIAKTAKQLVDVEYPIECDSIGCTH